jgi:hypothetical protein
VFLLLFSLALAEDLWAVAPAEGVRWPDVPTVSVKLTAGDEVEVMVRDGDKVRVRKGNDFGWVAATALTDVAPPKVEDAGPPGAGEPFPTVDLPGGEEKPASP